jgi:glutamyl-tRNA synthetase
LFSRAQLVQWFDGHHLAKSPAQWDAAKLNWVNGQTLKQLPDQELAGLAQALLRKRGQEPAEPALLARMCALFKDRCATTVELADWLGMYFAEVNPVAEEVQTHVTDAVRPALASLSEKLAKADWNKAAIAAALKETLAEQGLKMPQLAPAIRVLVCGRAQTPSVDAVLELFSREIVLRRLQRV